MAKPEEYLPPAPAVPAGPTPTGAAPVQRSGTTAVSSIPSGVDFQSRVDEVLAYITSRGFVFEPWQVAAFITAVRTKPFVLLAGISGTGKTKLPRLIAEGTGAECRIIPVRADWSDSSDLLGYERLNGSFQPGTLLRFAKEAGNKPEKQFFFVLDEMNIARVEYYFAEVLSYLEERRPNNEGRIVSEPLMPHLIENEDGEKWGEVRLPDNLCIVGSVNMDETTYGFSRKVLDRAFVIEFSTIDLTAISEVTEAPILEPWTSADWRALATSLAAHPARSGMDVQQMIETLTRVNKILEQGQLQFGYRVRDEIVLFCLAAQQCSDSFTTTSMGPVAPLDLAITMKVLPRIQGSGATVRRVLEGLKAWASPDTTGTSDEPGTGENIVFRSCADRLTLMIDRLDSGFASYWL
jgi:hypothetical protein